MPRQVENTQKLGDIIRELNDHHEAFLKAVAEDVRARAKREAKR